MRIPVIRGLIERRILVNYRVDPEVLGRVLPAPFRPKLVNGMGMVGICLIRLKHVRPAFLPGSFGFSSENVAHRMAVEWDISGIPREGVYVRRRDTNSRLNAWAGGRLFPGIHHRASFTVHETANHFEIDMHSLDKVTEVRVRGHRADRLPAQSVFKSQEEASNFFQAGSLGYSATPDPSRFQGLDLRCFNWNAEPLEIEEVHSSFFEDERLFPQGSITLDCALLMQGIEHEWHGQTDLCACVTADQT